jgi:hypothetical protein
LTASMTSEALVSGHHHVFPRVQTVSVWLLPARHVGHVPPGCTSMMSERIGSESERLRSGGCRMIDQLQLIAPVSDTHLALVLRSLRRAEQRAGSAEHGRHQS